MGFTQRESSVNINKPMPRPSDLPDYESPPVNEVVVGIQFDRASLTGAHIGAYWPTIRDRFPKVSEQIALDPRIENFGDPSSLPSPFGFALARPESRFWFTTRDEAELLQLQPDRCLFNWRSVENGPPYPHFEEIQKRFWEELDEWRQFATEQSIQLRTNQWEVSYVNKIEAAQPSTYLEDAFSFFGSGLSDGLGGAPESAHFSCQRVLMTETNQPWARGFVVVRAGLNAQRESQVHLELTVRGPGSEDVRIQELQLKAREWIVRGFDALTSKQMHKQWGRKQ